ncbi:MAG TPA: aminotransferase class IV [Bacteroidales bacterium]|nr:aminotransferase class IV [Bacteroidales bacterium]MDI9574088.1 aminotransferase class IV [Bacteroidota bacterium]MBP9511965.1 aminotransferase class IV [Bacteroidales bacterium]MBP9588684.1 aminotransferase class IV [Bacteroidales bacterium]NMD15451.1 aminotransferase class IV [Bacteroidales bacterium]
MDDKITEATQIDENIFSQGLTVYEVIRVIKGKLLFLEDHLKRFENSARNMGFQLSLSQKEITYRLYEMLHANGSLDGNIELDVNYRPDSFSPKQTFVAWYIPHHYPTEEEYRQGVKTGLFYYERKDPNIKYRNIDLKEKVKIFIEKNKIYESLLVDDGGAVTEGSKSNVFFIKENQFFTPPLSKVLPGVTRQKIIYLINQQNIVLNEGNIYVKTLNTYEASFLTGTSPKVLPIAFINEQSYNVNHPLLHFIMKSYDDIIESYLNEGINGLNQ